MAGADPWVYCYILIKIIFVTLDSYQLKMCVTAIREVNIGCEDRPGAINWSRTVRYLTRGCEWRRIFPGPRVICEPADSSRSPTPQDITDRS